MLQRGVRIGLVAMMLGAAVLGAGCAAATPEAAMVKVDGEVASLGYALRLAPGDGTMTKMTGDAARNALMAAGFRLQDEKDADVILELQLSDIEQKSFIVMTVNGKQQTKRAVTAVMRAVGTDGKVIDQHVAKFTVTQDEEVDEKKLAGLTNHFAKSAELERYSLERQIERVKGGGSPDGASDEEESPKAKKKGDKPSGKPKPRPDADDDAPDEVRPSPAAAGGEGRLARDAVQKVVRANMSGTRLCYERALGSNPNLKGRVEVRFTVGLDGTVTSAESGERTNLPDPAVIACVKQVFQRMEFPMPEGGEAKVSYPIEFKP